MNKFFSEIILTPINMLKAAGILKGQIYVFICVVVCACICCSCVELDTYFYY